MRRSKILLCLLALVITIQACSPAQLPTPQVITVVVTAVPSATATTADSAAGATPAPSPTSGTSAAAETLAPTPTSETPAATDTLAPSPTFTQQVIQANTPTRTPLPLPSVSNLPAQGPQGGNIDFGVVISSAYLMRIKAKKHGSSNDGDGIDHVLFIVNKKNGGKVYSNTEKTAKYCIFQGGEPDCNPWTISNGRYFWGTGGPEIVSGEYQVTIRVALKTDSTNESEWSFPITIKLP
jgi:hypothetical protein